MNYYVDTGRLLGCRFGYRGATRQLGCVGLMYLPSASPAFRPPEVLGPAFGVLCRYGAADVRQADWNRGPDGWLGDDRPLDRRVQGVLEC